MISEGHRRLVEVHRLAHSLEHRLVAAARVPRGIAMEVVDVVLGALVLGEEVLLANDQEQFLVP